MCWRGRIATVARFGESWTAEMCQMYLEQMESRLQNFTDALQKTMERKQRKEKMVSEISSRIAKREAFLESIGAVTRVEFRHHELQPTVESSQYLLDIWKDTLDSWRRSQIDIDLELQSVTGEIDACKQEILQTKRLLEHKRQAVQLPLCNQKRLPTKWLKPFPLQQLPASQ
jgi:chromosome segregation ATPase